MEAIPTMTELQDAADRAAQGSRDPADMRRALDEANRAREELRKTLGTVDLAVELIREARNA